MSPPVIMWFRQDLRTSHHAALNAAAAAGPVICLYILDDETPGKWKMGGASRWWLHHSLQQLSKNLTLVLRRGRADAVLMEVIAETGATALYFTRDYAPWSQALEQRIKENCEQCGAHCHRFGGHLLHEPEAIRNATGQPYKVYTPFSKACLAAGDPKLPQATQEITPFQSAVKSDALSDWRLLPTHPNWAKDFETTWQPGEAGAKQSLSRFVENALAGYAQGRDRPDKPATSKLSAHLHWGEISPAQCWTEIRSAVDHIGASDQGAEKFLKEILWREFCYNILFHWPTLPTEPFRPEFADFPFRQDEFALNKWRRGETGYPIVDAGMRQLWATGTMHNRVRMVVASFLTKHLLLSWQEGAAWFWDCLVDADIASNSANWQWVAGSGADAAPYFRIFNPVLQGMKFDPQGEYVRHWLPELRDIPIEFIHHPWDSPIPAQYPKPIVDHGFARDRALHALKTIKASSA